MSVDHTFLERQPFRERANHLEETFKGQGPPQSPPPGGGMEARIAKLEAGVEHIQSDIKDLKSDVRSLRDKLDEVKESISSGKVWAVLLYAALAGGLLAVLARGFKWI